MVNDSTGSEWETGHWDQLYDVLSAQPRRMIILSLLKEPEGRRLRLPDAAQSANQPMDSEKLRLNLHHRHLPKLAEPGYIDWESDPFCVQRGPHFEEPALVISKLTESTEDYPPRLREECVVIGDMVGGKSD